MFNASSSSSTAGGSIIFSSSTGTSNSTIPDFFGTSAPNGLVAYGVVCFLGVIAFTVLFTVYYARPKLPPMVGMLTFLAWSEP
jgi:hypothetical protein